MTVLSSSPFQALYLRQFLESILCSIILLYICQRSHVSNCFCTKYFLIKIVVSTVPKMNLLIVLPYLGRLSLRVCARIIRVMKNELLHCNFRIVFQTKCKLINLFAFKDRIPVFMRSDIVYKFKCGVCNATYYDKTRRHSKVRMCENFGVSALTGKRLKGDNDSAIKNIIYFAIIYLVLKNFSY